jgi:hypothetical protein
LETWHEVIEGVELMLPISLSWAIGLGNACQGGSSKYPTLDEVMTTLGEVSKNSGSMTIRPIPQPEVGPQNLEVIADNGNFILSLGVDDGEDYVVKTYTNVSTTIDQVNVLGNLWDSTLICTDLSVVIKVFREFLETGNVSEDLLS